MNIDSLVRPNIRKLKPYSSARSLYQSGVFFDANENALRSAVELPGYPDLNRYPDPYSADLRKALANYLGVEQKNVFAGNGSDEVIDLLIRIFVNTDEAVAVMEPAYGMYRVAADTAGVEVVSCDLDKEFQIDLGSLWDKLGPKVKIIFLCSPNNPTGNLMRPESIREICSRFNGVVVVDEAYIEFASAPSLVKEIRAFKNLIVMRTLSKAWGLAGLRIGYAAADEAIIGYLDKVKPPYNVNRVSAAIAIEALRNENVMTLTRKTVLEEREVLEEKLRALNFRVFPSEANFLLVKYPGISSVVKDLAQEDGLIIRDFGGRRRLEDCVRITVGTPRENALLLYALTKRL